MSKNNQISTCALLLITSLCLAQQRIPIETLFGCPDKTLPQISPDGTHIAYLAEHNHVLNVWVRSINGGDDHALTTIKQRGIPPYFWSYKGEMAPYLWARNGKSLLYFYDKDGSENFQLYHVDRETGTTTCLTPFERVRARFIEYSECCPDHILIGLNRENHDLFDAYDINILTGDCTLAFKNPGTVDGIFADQHLNIRCVTTLDNGNVNVLVRETPASSWRTIIHWENDDAANSRVVGLDRDGETLYVLDSRTRNTNQLVAIHIRDNSSQTIFANANSDYDIDKVWFTPNTSKPRTVLIQKERAELVALNPCYANDIEQLRSSAYGDIVYLSTTSNDAVWLVGYNCDTAPLRYYLYDRTQQKITFLFSAQTALEQYQLQPTYPINFTASDGLLIHGYLTQSSENRAQRPLVLLVHGGPWWRDVWGYDPDVQFLVNRGYSCLQINYRGSTGYGKNFLTAGNKEWGRRIYQDLVDATHWTIEQHIADPKRIAIMGASYGGYSALCGAAFTPDLFCCAVDLFGFCNIVSLVKNWPTYNTSFLTQIKKRVGDIQTEEAMLKERSPLFKADQITCPLFIAQGANDARITMTEPNQLIAALKKHNRPYTYLVFENEGHGLIDPHNTLKLMQAIEKFFALHIKT